MGEYLQSGCLVLVDDVYAFGCRGAEALGDEIGLGQHALDALPNGFSAFSAGIGMGGAIGAKIFKRIRHQTVQKSFGGDLFGPQD